jgi:hypothetical protein
VQEVPTLQSSPLFLVAESYGGKYAATLGVSVARAISAAEINLTLGGKDLDHSVRQQVTKQSRISPLLFLCVSSSSQLLLFCDRRRPRRQLDLAGRFHCEGTLPRKIKRVPNLPSPIDFVHVSFVPLVFFLMQLSYGRLLQDISRLDSAGANEANR